MSTMTLSVPDISCAHCKMSIEGAVRPLAGVETVEVHIDAKTVDIKWDESTLPLEKIVDAIEDQGYEVDGH
jgi:copper chaperone